MIKKKDFIAKDYIGSVFKQDYERITTCIQTADMISHMTYKGIYIFDFYKRSFLYVSNNSFFFGGMSAEKVKKSGYGFFRDHVPRKELVLLREITRAAFSFLEQVPDEERLSYTVSCNFHLIQTNSSTERLVNHLCTPIELTKNGKIRLAFCIVSIPTFERSYVKCSRLKVI